MRANRGLNAARALTTLAVAPVFSLGSTPSLPIRGCSSVDGGHSLVQSSTCQQQTIEAFAVDPVPSISLGSTEIPNQQFLWVRDATVLQDGRIAVLDGASREVRIFSDDRDLGVALGGEGDGPGEYRGPQSIRQLPSTDLQVFDVILGRLTTISMDDAGVATESLVGGLVSVPVLIGRAFDSGAVPYTQVDRSILDSDRREGLRRHDLMIRIFTENGPATIATVPNGDSFFVRDGGRGLTKPVPMSPQPLVAFGESVAVVGTTHSTRFRILDEEGSRVGELRAVGASEAPTRRDWDLFEQAFLAENRAPPRIGGIPMPPAEDYRLPRELLSKAPRGDRKPIFDRAILRGDQELWLREFDLQNEESTWQILHVNGGRARALLPRSWEILEVGDSYVLTLRRDELERELVHLHDLRR